MDDVHAARCEIVVNLGLAGEVVARTQERVGRPDTERLHPLHQQIFARISSMLLGIFGGAAVGWLIGRTIYFFEVELPYRNLHLPPGEFQAATCGLSTSIAITTFYMLIPAGIFLGSLIGFGVGMAQERE